MRQGFAANGTGVCNVREQRGMLLDVGLVQVYLPLKRWLRVGRQNYKGRLFRIFKDLILRLDRLLGSGIGIKNDLFADEKEVLFTPCH